MDHVQDCKSNVYVGKNISVAMWHIVARSQIFAAPLIFMV